MSKLRILWGAEIPTLPTGYAVVTRNIIKRLCERGHEVFVLGWNYNGEDFKHEEGWTLVHAGLGGFGADQLGDNFSLLDYHLTTLRPDVYVSLIDPWFIGHAVRSTNLTKVPYVAYLPIDGYPFSYAWKDILKLLHTPMWMSKFGQKVFSDFVDSYASSGDRGVLRDPMLDRFLNNPGPMLYHGVDTEMFKPLSPEEKFKAKTDVGLGEFDFIFLSVGKNTNRKQQPRLLQAFAKVLQRVENPSKHCLLFHCGDAQDQAGLGGWNLPLMVKQMGLEHNVRFTDKGNPLHGLDTDQLAILYGCADVHVLSTGGEGFGVPTAEALACGVPVILPDNSTGPELAGPALSRAGAHERARGEPTDASKMMETERGWLVKCSDSICGPKWGVILGLVDIDGLADAMVASASDPTATATKGEACRNWAVRNLDWELITDHAEEILTTTANTEHPLGMNSTVALE